jgi:hypothetical protein
MSKVVVDAGCCRYKAVVRAKKTGKMTVCVTISSACEMLTDMNPELAEVDWRRGVFEAISDCTVYQICSKHIRHAACPVPAAILKAIEVEAGLALPVDVTMKIESGHDD